MSITTASRWFLVIVVVWLGYALSTKETEGVIAFTVVVICIVIMFIGRKIDFPDGDDL